MMDFVPAAIGHIHRVLAIVAMPCLYGGFLDAHHKLSLIILDLTQFHKTRDIHQ